MMMFTDTPEQNTERTPDSSVDVSGTPANAVFEFTPMRHKPDPIPEATAKEAEEPECAPEIQTEASETKVEEKVEAPAAIVPEEPQEIAQDSPAEAETVEVPKVEIIGIRFKKSGKTYYFAPGKIHGEKGKYAIVETARGQECGEITLGNTFVPESEIVPPIRPVIRIATDNDIEHLEQNKQKEDDAFRICLKKIEEHRLDMKLVEAQYTFDNSKLLFYFTSSGRVDFRELVKDLASVFRTRIELRQIGIRDEAKLIGGLGSCGRPLCCAGFLSDFGQVSIKMAKEQNLSLNSAKISGTCGRLMCCLRYEYETYCEEIRRTPPVDSTIRTPEGIGTVIETSPLAGTVKVRLVSDPDAPPKIFSRDDVQVVDRHAAMAEAEKKQEPDISDRIPPLPTTETTPSHKPFSEKRQPAMRLHNHENCEENAEDRHRRADRPRNDRRNGDGMRPKHPVPTEDENAQNRRPNRSQFAQGAPRPHHRKRPDNRQGQRPQGKGRSPEKSTSDKD